MMEKAGIDTELFTYIALGSEPPRLPLETGVSHP